MVFMSAKTGGQISAEEKIKELEDRLCGLEKYIEDLKKKSMPPKEEDRTEVYVCEYFEYDDNDLSGYGGTWTFCHNEKSGRKECNCGTIYAQQFCPFYKKGKLRGKWVIDETDKEVAIRFTKEFQNE